ncbi:MAG: MgtC/SapB family protein [Chloroflexota bacterium]|nr:MgtC/SapB family protein [Chloroflexota bacterium]
MPIDALLANPEAEGLFRIVLAGAIGVIVGFEREIDRKPAGARTYGGVAMGASTFTVVAILAFGAGDPASRVAAQIITGIGFLGAGTILHTRLRVRGLTTAAGLWMMAAVGMAIGSGLYLVGIGAGVAILLLLQFLEPHRLLGRRAGEDEDESVGGDEAGEP